MTEDNAYGLAELHGELIEALDKLNEICVSNGISYSLHGGTLLGAVRNNKIIPWDDDADVSMTRENYRKFEAVCAGNRDDCYITLSGLNGGWVSRFVTRSNAGTIIAIDVFIWDYISEHRLGQFLKINLLRAVQGMMKNGPVQKKVGFVYRVLLGITRAAGKLVSTEKKQRLYRYIEENVLTGKKKYIHRSNDAFLPCGIILDAGCMGEYTTILLEGKQYMVSSRYVDILKTSYGEDYMTPPPESQRVPPHPAVRDSLQK